MSDVTADWRQRIARLKEVCGASLTGPGMRSDTPLVAVTSSRLGVDARLLRHACQFLRRSVIECEQRGGELLVGSGSAIEPWAERAAELFGVPCRKLAVFPVPATDHLMVSCPDPASISVDAAVIAVADRVDAVYVRRGGRVASCLRQRLSASLDASIRVAVSPFGKCAASQLMREGAVGWLDLANKEQEVRSADSLPCGARAAVVDRPEDSWGRSEGQWLIHCTRGRVGKWPDETERQYRDALLLGDASSARRGPLDALLRILRVGRIVASARASSHGFPVVCFSALSLQKLLAGRCFRPHLGRWDYEPFGVAIRISAAREQGAQPVIYVSRADRAGLPEQDRFRIHPSGKKHDWRWEREWRVCRTLDLRAIDPRDIRVFALDSVAARSALRDCPWQVSFLLTVE